MAEELTEGVVMKALDWAYKSAVEGVKGVNSAQTLAVEYLATEGSVRDQVNRLIGLSWGSLFLLIQVDVLIRAFAGNAMRARLPQNAGSPAEEKDAPHSDTTAMRSAGSPESRRRAA